MSSNTIKRVVSAIVLVSILGVSFYFGSEPSLALLLIFFVLANDEIFANFYNNNRLSLQYLGSQCLIVGPYVFLNFFDNSPGIRDMFVNAAVLLNLGLLVYLFYVSMESKLLPVLGDKFPVVTGGYFLLPAMALGTMFHYEKWRLLLCVILVVTYGMDTGAWFFGKNFGAHKLWPKVSPNKTVEGLIGGMLTSGILGGICWHLFFGNMSLILFALFTFLGLMSQLGDLVQSKIKRQFSVKDSSALIPGHGGVYDRIDSLMFVGPFYVTALRYFYFN